MEEEKRLSWKNMIIWTGGDGPYRVFDIYIDIVVEYEFFI